MTQPHKSVSAPDAKQEGREMVMIVDDDITNIRVGKNALAGVYDVFTIPSAAKMFDLLNRNTPAMILLDIDMPEMDGYTAIKALKADPNTRDIPVIFLTSKNDSGSELEGLSLGAIDYITKPFQPALLRKRIEVHLMVEAQKHKLEAQARILEEQRKKLLDFNNNLQKLVE
jgi:PleD family two-component response regulator